MKIILATDHAGYEHKEVLKDWLIERGYVVEDMTPEYNQDDDYPDTIAPAARKLAREHGAKAIIFGGSGQGEAMVANRVSGVRAAVYYGGSEEIVTLSREHNDANALSIGARFVSVADMLVAVERWLQTAFSGVERHQRRIEKIDLPWAESHNI